MHKKYSQYNILATFCFQCSSLLHHCTNCDLSKSNFLSQTINKLPLFAVLSFRFVLFLDSLLFCTYILLAYPAILCQTTLTATYLPLTKHAHTQTHMYSGKKEINSCNNYNKGNKTGP